MKKMIWIVIGLILIASLLSSCSSSSRSSHSSYDGYSSTYKNNSEYRKNVDDVAAVYGTDSKHVDAVINALSNGN